MDIEPDEYQPRTPERLAEILRAQSVNPRSWQREAADIIEKYKRRAELAEAELAALDRSHRDLAKRLASK